MTETAEEFMRQRSARWERERERDIGMKDIGRKGKHEWVREAWTFHPQTNYPEKVFSIERLRHSRLLGQTAHEGGAVPGDIEYRIGYWVVGRIGRANGHWRWGQYCPMIPAQDLEPLLAKARAEGTLLG